MKLGLKKKEIDMSKFLFEIYGQYGSGKSTIASKFPGAELNVPLIIVETQGNQFRFVNQNVRNQLPVRAIRLLYFDSLKKFSLPR